MLGSTTGEPDHLFSKYLETNIEKFVFCTETIPWTSQSTNWKKMFGTYNKGLIPLICKEFLSKSIQSDPNLKWEKDMNIKITVKKVFWERLT